MSTARWILFVLVALGTADLFASSGRVARAAPRLGRRANGTVRGPLVWAWTALVLTYRAASSGRVGGVCRFEPSCSAYALDAVRLHGGVRGGVFVGYRLLRCQPLSKGGYDPVPAWQPARGRACSPAFFRSRRGRPASAADRSVGTRV